MVTLAIDHARRVRNQPGMRTLRVSKLDDKVLWNLTPPRLRVELAVLQVASERLSRRGEAAAVAVLADACQRRVTTPSRLCASLNDLPSLGGRGFLRLVLSDVAQGAYSVLEHRYLTRVERAHALPRASRQHPFKRTTSGFRDVYYEKQRLLVELDGRLGHEWASDQWDDLERDLRSATEGLQTVRLGWGAVSSSCKLAGLMSGVLGVRGWTGVTATLLELP